MYISLFAKNKLGFIEGTCVKENYEPSMHHICDRCNALIFTWIMNFVSREIMISIVYSTSVLQVWKDLSEKFNKINCSRFFQLHRDISLAQLGVQTIIEIFLDCI